MKKLTTLLLSAFSIVVFAQTQQDGIDYSKVIKQNINKDKSATVIWSEDFSNGFPSGWATYSNNTGSGNSGASNPSNFATCPWKYSTVGSWGYWNSEPKDANNNPIQASDAINSTTAFNGFLISDIDSANHWNGGGSNGGTSGSNSGSSYHYLESYFITSSINTLGYSSVSLEFEHTFRLNNGVDLVVSVSNDSVSWTDFFVQGNIQNNSQSADPELLNLNISSIAGNQSSVYIKIGWTARVYFWMIDDIRIIETPNNLVGISDDVYGGWWEGYQSVGGIGCNYTFNPIVQATANPYSLEAVIANTGAASQTMRLDAEIKDGIQSTVFTSSSSSNILGPSQQDTFVVAQQFSPLSTGQYDIKMWGVGDSAFTDTVSFQTIVTDYIYGKDENDYQGWYLVADPVRQNHVTSYYDIYADADLTAIDVYISPQTNPGANIYGVLYEGNTSGSPVFLDQTDDYTVTAADLGSWITLPLDIPYTVNAGLSYEIAAAGYQGFDTLKIGYSGLAIGTENSLFDENGTSTNSNGSPTWYYITKNPMIRMNFDPGLVSISEKESLQEVSIYPNPVCNEVEIELEGLENGLYTLDFLDFLGKKVFSKDVFYDNQSVKIDISFLSNGLYMLNINNDKLNISKQFMKQ